MIALGDIPLTLPRLASSSLAPADALGCVSAGAVMVDQALPATHVALRHGRAVAAIDCLGASAYAPVPLGSVPAVIRPGEALPAGCDAVVDPDAVLDGVVAEVLEAPAPGDGCRFAGDDLAPGRTILRRGQTVGPAAVLALEAAGIRKIEVLRPVIAIEHDEGGAALAGWLASEAGLLGCRITGTGSDGPAFKVVIAAGPTPDRTAAPALRPGESISFTHGADGVRLLVPPVPAAVLAAYCAFVLPLVAGLTLRRPAIVTRPLTGKVSSAVGLTDLVLLAGDESGWRPLAVGDAPLGAWLDAAAFALVPPDSEGLPAGAPLAATPFERSLIAEVA